MYHYQSTNSSTYVFYILSPTRWWHGKERDRRLETHVSNKPSNYKSSCGIAWSVHTSCGLLFLWWTRTVFFWARDWTCLGGSGRRAVSVVGLLGSSVGVGLTRAGAGDTGFTGGRTRTFLFTVRDRDCCEGGSGGRAVSVVVLLGSSTTRATATGSTAGRQGPPVTCDKTSYM